MHSFHGFARSLAPLAVFAIAAVDDCLAAAQLTVGPAGSGATFEEIQAAIDAAQAGDVILVAPGNYGPIDVPKGVSILGATSGGVVIDALFTVGAVVHDVPAGERVVLSGLDVRATPLFGFGANFSIGVHDCAATVVLHDVRAGLQPFSSGPGIGVNLRDCERVLLLSSTIDGAGTDALAAVEVLRSELFMADSTVVGLTNAFSGFISSGAMGLRADESTVRVWRSTLEGGDGSGGKPVFPGTAGNGGAGLVAIDSTVELFGGSVGELRGGDGGPPGLFGAIGQGASGLVLEQSAVVRVQVGIPVSAGVDGDGLGGPTATMVDGTSSLVLESDVFPVISTTTALVASGTSAVLDLEGEPGSAHFLWAAAGLGPDLSIAGVEGVVVLDPSSLLLVGVIPLDGAGQAQLSVAVPATPSVLGAVVPLQSAAATASGLALSNPLVVTIPD